MSFFILRVVLFTLFRFGVLMALVLLSQGFEVSPLPEWTLYGFVFLMQFLVTFACAFLAIARRLPRATEWVLLSVAFLLIETLLEFQLYVWLTDGAWRDLFRAFGWKTLIPLVSYFIAVTLAVRSKRRVLLQAHVPEGVRL